MRLQTPVVTARAHLHSAGSRIDSPATRLYEVDLLDSGKGIVEGRLVGPAGELLAVDFADHLDTIAAATVWSLPDLSGTGASFQVDTNRLSAGGV